MYFNNNDQEGFAHKFGMLFQFAVKEIRICKATSNVIFSITGLTPVVRKQSNDVILVNQNNAHAKR